MKSESVRQPSYYKSILITMLTFSLVIILALSAFLTFNYTKSALDLIREYNRNLLEQTNYSIQQMNDDASRLNHVLFSDNQIISYLDMEERDPYTIVLAARALNRQLLTLPNVTSIYLYNAELDLFYNSLTGEQLSGERFPDTTVYGCIRDPQFHDSYSGIPVAVKMPASAQTASSLSYIMFDSPAKQDGLCNAIVVNVNPSRLTDSIHSINLPAQKRLNNIVIMEESGTILSSSLSPELAADTELYSALQKQLPRPDKKGQRLSLGNKNYLVTCSVSNSNGWYLIALIPEEEIYRDIAFPSIVGVCITILFLLTGFFVSLGLSRKLNSPVRMVAELLSGQQKASLPSDMPAGREFSAIVSSYTQMQENNRRLERLRMENSSNIKQDCLNTLLTGNSTNPENQTLHTLKNLNLSWIADCPLCMAVLKFDRYAQLVDEKDRDELWALRFAVVNVAEELARKSFSATAFSREGDKFILLVCCREEDSFRDHQAKIEQLLEEVQEKTASYLRISVSAAYSTVFSGLAHLPTMYQNMCESLRLKIRYGHGCIIAPSMLDQVNTNIFRLPPQKMEQLVSLLCEDKYEQACPLYQGLSGQLYRYSYSEISSANIRIVYRIYSDVVNRYSDLNEELTELLKDCLHEMQNAEVAEDLEGAICLFMEKLCQQIRLTKSANPHQATELIVSKVSCLVEQKYADPSLCLSSIAEELGRSPNYVGKVFRGATQKSVAQYILDYRMDKLAASLQQCSGASLASLLEKVGMEKSNYFYTQFKKHFGVSLGEYRLMLENGQLKAEESVSSPPV